jgi:capsule polysaccharide export protein KpsE/RkpR
MPTAPDLSFLRNRTSRIRILATIVCAALLGTAYALLAPQWFRSSLSVVATKPQRQGVAGLLGADLGGLAAGLDSSLSGGADTARIAAVLQSNVLTDEVIEHFHLKERYREEYQELAREALWRHCETKVLPKPGLVQLSCEDKDPRFAKEMVEFFAERGNLVFRRVNETSASEEVRFLETRVAELRGKADDTAARVREFQEKHGVVDLDSQSKALVSAMSALNAQRINKKLELDFARTFSSDDEATLRQLQSQVAVMDEQIRDLEAPAAADGAARGGRKGSASSMFPAALDVPRLRAEYELLFRERKVAEATLVFALERLEAARANEARNVSTFIVLDPPTLATRRSRPKRAMVLVLATLLGCGLGVGYEWVRSAGGPMRALQAVAGAVRRAS